MTPPLRATEGRTVAAPFSRPRRASRALRAFCATAPVCRAHGRGPGCVSRRRPRQLTMMASAGSGTARSVALALDVGTSGTKAGLFCVETGAELCLAYAEHGTASMGAAQVRTQNVLDWRASVSAAAGEALACAAATPTGARPSACPVSVAVVACTGSMQNVALASPAPGLSADVPVLGDGTVMLYSDARASEQAARLSASLGMPVASTSLLAKLAYLDDHRVPRRRLQLSLGAADALVFDLCACLVTDPTNASTTGLTSPPHRAYDAGLLSRAGLDGWTPALPPISSGIPRVCAHVSAAAAGGFGLPQLAGVPVVHAGGDAASATLGAGCASPEDGRYLYVGSSGWVGRTVAGNGLASEQAARSKNGVLYLAHPHSPAHSLEVGSMSDAGSCLTWAARTLLGDMSVARLVHLAGQAPVGSNGVTFSPWLTGRRCPSPCTAATASLQGVTSGTQSADIARAVLEGVAFGLRGCLDATRDGRGAPRDLSLAFVGGGAQSAVMSRILAGVLGCELRVRARRSVGVVGAATVGLRAIGRDCHVGRVDGDGGRAATVTASELEREAYDALWNAGLGAA